MEKLRLAYKTSSISYIRMGTGARPAFCFHGYGEDASSFSFLERYAGDQFTFFAIDLPFHGNTKWNEGHNCTTSDIRQIIEAILNEVNPKPAYAMVWSGQPETPKPKLQTQNPKLTLIGFSLGGRVALALYEIIPSQVERLVLLAPDGLKVNFWYWFSTQTWIGNKLFLLTMKHPSWFFGFLKALNKLKLVNASIFKFVNYYIGDKEIRESLYSRWTTLRKIKPHQDHIRHLIKNNNSIVRLVYGSHDRIILSSVGEKFRNGIEEYCTISVIHSGHQVLHEKHVEEILPALLY